MNSGGFFLKKKQVHKDAIMPAQIQYQADDIFVLRISGILKRSEFGAEEEALARRIDTDRTLACW
jgi:hypothetical protein